MINVENLTFTYTGTSAPAIHDLTFSVAAGEIFGFLGPSGSGKTTTQKILNGLLRDYVGQVTVMDNEVSRWGSDYYEHIGVSFELPNHYLKLTANENLKYFASLYKNETVTSAELLTWVGLEADGDTLVSQYSKGMKNRLSVARALLHRPKLLFLDEPTAGLDPVNARRIKQVIRQQQQEGRTIFLTTHDMAVANELCDRVAFIVDGAIRVIDSPRQLRLHHGEARVRVEYQANGVLERQDFEIAGIGRNDAFLALLQSDAVETIHTQEATLEDIFIELTGRRLS
jgi:fluoroquinolone transport system ATP-binding protein